MDEWIVTWRQKHVRADGWFYYWVVYSDHATAVRTFNTYAAPYAGGPIEYKDVRLSKVEVEDGE